MVLDLLGRFTPLLLLLGLWGPVYPLYAVPPNLTKAQWFEIQHIQRSPLQCNTAMRGVNRYTRHCKPQNTFLHASYGNVIATCRERNIVCRNRQNNCHQSSSRVRVTICYHTGGIYPNCRYRDTPRYKYYVIACDPPQSTDPRYPLVPVHLDRVI